MYVCGWVLRVSPFQLNVKRGFPKEKPPCGGGGSLFGCEFQFGPSGGPSKFAHDSHPPTCETTFLFKVIAILVYAVLSGKATNHF